MQTLKTAIVVVLLATVTISAYMALTAPPAELPPELKTLIEANGGDGTFDLGIDSGMPDALADDSPLPPPLGGDDSAPPQNPADRPSMPLGPGGYVEGNSTPLDDELASDRAQLRLSDQPPHADHDHDHSEHSEQGAPQPLPKPTPGAGAVAADPNGEYPSTDAGDFSLDLDLPDSSEDLAASSSSASGYSLPDLGQGSAAASSDGKNASGSSQPSGGAPDDESLARDAVHTKLANAIATADRQCELDQLRQALTTLSLFYNTPGLSAEDRSPLLARLDYLAGEVIYSTRHLLEQPYRVNQGETLKTIAGQLQVPWQLLGTINGVSDPAAVVPGQELKVMRGPFRAEVSLDRTELTLFVGELYAGRFPVTIGTTPAPKAGSYTVLAKQTDRSYYPLNGTTVPGGDPRNPYGSVWLDLGNEMCIHGSSPQGPAPDAGCIQLRPEDAQDVFAILSQGSDVSILR